MIVGRPPLRPPSLHWTMAPDGFGRPAWWRLVCGVAPPLPHLRHRHPTTATATSWSETQLETHHPRPIVGLESPIGLFVQGGQVTSLLTIDFYLPCFHISIKLFVLGGGHYSSLQSTPFTSIFHKFHQRNTHQALMIYGPFLQVLPWNGRENNNIINAYSTADITDCHSSIGL